MYFGFLLFLNLKNKKNYVLDVINPKGITVFFATDLGPKPLNNADTIKIIMIIKIEIPMNLNQLLFNKSDKSTGDWS